MKEMQELIQSAVDDMVTSGKLEDVIRAKVEATMTSVVDDQLRSYSDFGKKLSEYVKGALNVNFEVLDIAGYNQFILDVIQRQLDGRLQDETAKRVKEDIEKLLGHPPKNVSLSGLIEDFKKKVVEDDDSDAEEIAFFWEDKGLFQYAGWDKGPQTRRSACEYMIGFYEGKPFSFRIGGYDPKERLFMGRLFEFDRKLFQIYTTGVDVILDPENVDTELPSRHYD